MKDNPAFGRQIITVGPAGSDVAGFTGGAVQLAIDALGCRGGGTVVVREGTYELIDSVRLRPDIALVGEGEAVLKRAAELTWSPLAMDADAGQYEITPADVKGFRVGMGVCLWDQDRSWVFHGWPQRVRAIEGGRLLLEEMMPDMDRLADCGGRVVNHFPLVMAREAPRSRAEGLTLDGSAGDSPVLENLRTAGFHSYHSPGVSVQRIRAHHVQGDGICVSESSTDAVVEDCHAHDNTHHGIHPGSHSARAVVRRCHMHHNGSDGLYVCWGIAGGVFEDNDIHHNGSRLWRSGISIGHKDTDCLFARNRIYENCKYGICIRQKTEANGAHRNTYRQNVIENNGQDPAGMPEAVRRLPARELAGVGVSILGVTHDLLFEDNVIRETRPAGKQFQRNAFYIGPGVSRVTLSGNEIAGHPDAAVVDESGSKDNRLQ